MSRFIGATTRVVVSLLLLVTVVLPNALALAAAGCGRVTQSGWWYTYDVPDFAGGGPITDFAIDAFHPTTMYATDGSQVLRTTNGGCTWPEVFSTEGKIPLDYGFRGDASTIEDVHVPRSPQAGRSVLLVIREDAGGAARPHVLRSTSRGDEWQSGTGLTPAGDPATLLTSSVDPSIGYLGIDVGGGSLDLLFATADGGATWTLRSDLTRTEPNRAIEELAIDPLDPVALWAYGPGGLWESSDGGASFTRIPQFTGEEVVEMSVFHAPSRTLPILFAFRGSSHEDVQVSLDGGETWRRIDTPDVVDSAAYGRTPQELMISVTGRVFFLHWATESWVGVTVPRPGIGGLVSDIALEQDFYGHTAGTIERYDGPTTTPRPGPGGGGGPIFQVPGLDPPPEVRPPAPPALAPAGAKVRMKTGAARTVDYRLKLSEKPTKLDLFFLLDTSDTMSGTIQGLIFSVHGIIQRLNDAGLDAQFGIGVSRAYTDTAVPREPCESETDQNCERNFIYRRLVDLSDFSNADQLEEALAGLRAEAGGRFDSQLGALYQIATGAGQDDAPPGMQESDVPPGLDASFRHGDDTLRLVFVATDEPFATGDEGDRDPTQISDFGRITPPDIPSFEEVAAAFGEVDVQVLGLAIGQTLKTDKDPGGGGPTPLEDMQRIAELTGALAPDGGVDCDADGVTDLSAGLPLVCPVRRHNVADGKNLAAAIFKLVQAVRGTEEIELEVVKGEDVVAGIRPAVYPDVVLQQPNLLDYEVTYRCPDRLQGETVTVRLEATTPAATLDSVTTTVTCLEEKVDEPLPLDPVVAFGLVLPPLLPPAPPPIVEIAPGAQGQAQSQSQAQAQAAMAAQEQEQPQLAYVAATLDHRQALAEEEAMSPYRRRSEVPPWATLGTGAVLMSLAYGWLTLSRQRVRVQRAWIGRTRRY